MTQTNYIIFFISYSNIIRSIRDLVTGPALPDISVVLVCIFFVLLIKRQTIFILRFICLLFFFFG